MGADSPVPQDELRRLKSLLFRPEQSQLDDVRSDVAELKRRVGDKESLETATAEILVNAFRRAETTEHRALAAAVAPTVVAAIRSEIKNSRDMMVEALHPIAGRMVAAAVSKAFSDLVSNLNAKIEALMSARSWRWKLQSWMSGRPVSEIALAEAHRPSIRKIIILERGSGILKAYWDADQDSRQKPDLISGLIAAITEFSANVFDQQSGELRSLDFGSGRIFLDTSAQKIVAAEVTGPVSSDDESTLEDMLTRLLLLEESAQPADGAVLERHALDAFPPLEMAAGKKAVGRPLLIVIILLALALAWFGYRSLTRLFVERAANQAIADVVARSPDLKPFPLELQFNHEQKRVSVTGIMPEQSMSKRIADAIGSATPNYKLSSNIALVATDAQASGLVQKSRTELAEQIATLQRQFDTTFAMINKSLLARDKEFQTETTALARRIDAVNGRVAGIAASLATIRKTFDSEGARKQAVAAELGKTERNIEALRQALKQATSQIDGINRKFITLATQSEKIAETVQGNMAQLRDYLVRHAIFFDTDTKLRDPADAATHIDRIAKLLDTTGLAIRVIGYGDDTGSLPINRELSLKRAEVVANMLRARGVRADRIVTVGRVAQSPIVQTIGGKSNINRRVILELPFANERPSR